MTIRSFCVRGTLLHNAMHIFSATDAISPAIARTKLVLFTPFRWGRSWKLAVTAYLGAAGTIFVPFTLIYLPGAAFLFRANHVEAYLLVAAALLATALYVWLYTACSRLQFAFFDIVLNRGRFVAPAWRKYRAVASRWTWTKVTFGLLATLAIALLMAAPTLSLVRGFRNMPSSALAEQTRPGLPTPSVWHLMMGFYSVYFGFLLLFALYYLLMSSASAFMVPTMALEGITPRASFSRFVAFVKHQTGAFFGFIGIRLVIGIAGYMAFAFVYEIAVLILMAVAALIGFAGYELLHALHVPVAVMLVLGALLLIAVVFGVNGYLLFLSLGTFLTFFEAHTQYFLAGRYPPLGELLERSTPQPLQAEPPPVTYPGWTPPPSGPVAPVP